MSTAHQLYQRQPLGFPDFQAWMRHHERVRAEMRKVLPADHPLAQDMGPEWLELWLGVQELLKMQARIEYFPARYREWTPIFGIVERVAVAQCLQKAMTSPLLRGEMVRVVLLDGTIIKEWGPQ